jgi:predicted SAM-dependent methyltransferase
MEIGDAAGAGEGKSMRLNLGACDRAFPGFISVDIAPPADVITDLNQRWPWDDSTADEVRAHDLLEHLDSRIHSFNELHRILKPGARATIEVPSATKGAGWAQDPTHKTPYCMNSFQYFEDGSFAHQRLARHYGITARFKILELSEREYMDVREPVWKITAVLEAVK